MAIFISHASDDDGFVTELRRRLEAHGLPVWVDSRNLRGGDRLNPAIEEAIRRADHCLVLLSPRTVNSVWVRREIRLAEQVAAERQGFRVVPLLLDGIEPTALELWFKEEPVGVRVKLETSGLDTAFPQVLAALGVQLPSDFQPFEAPDERPLADLLLELSDPSLSLEASKQRLRATATLVYEPPDYPQAPRVEGRPFVFTAPLGPIEAEELRWYLERFHIWPVGLFREQAQGIEARLPQWGGKLFDSALAGDASRAPLEAWRQAKGMARRFSVEVDHVLPEGSEDERRQNALEAATVLMSLPWELLHDGDSYLFQGAEPVAVRRRLPNRKAQGAVQAELPIRILLVSPRPEDEAAGYIDHRVSALALVQATADLGDLAELRELDPPTYPALGQALKTARERGRPFDVVHFDGHGVFDAKHGLGALCFEDPKDADKLQGRATALIHADEMAALIRDHRIPLIFLEACQSAQSDKKPTASVAAKLLEQGCSAVVAMGYSVLVETARRFTGAFYGELAQGKRVGEAFLAGQSALHDDSYRLEVMGAGRLELKDWFVPVLYQEAQDPVLFTRLPPAELKRLQAERRTLSLGELPASPRQTFIGRSRELLALERLLQQKPYALICGTGGAGKTTLAAELARWLVATGRFARAAFVSLEDYSDPRTVLDSLGRQLVAGWKSVAEYSGLDEAGKHLDRALRDRSTILVLDNCESILPHADKAQKSASDAEPSSEQTRLEKFLHLFGRIQATDPRARLLFTSREPLPAPFDHQRRALALGPLSDKDAIDLVAHVLKLQGLEPRNTDPGRTSEEISDLVEATGRHARALVLLAPEIARRGVRATTEALREIMADLDRRHQGDRERSLYASIQLSLERLPAEIRKQLPVLAPFRGGAHMGAITILLGGDEGAAQRLAAALIQGGLANDRGIGHLGLDPALPEFLAQGLEEHQALESHWAEAMTVLLESVYQQRLEDSQLAAELTHLELRNLLRLLDWCEENAEPGKIVRSASNIEGLISNLNLPRALARVEAVRKRAGRKLLPQNWSHANYLYHAGTIDRLIEQGNFDAALTRAQALTQHCLAAEDDPFREAAYDAAMAHYRLGKVLEMSGQAEVALRPIREAKMRFDNLVAPEAKRMISACLVEQGNCLKFLGRLEEAASRYKESIAWAERLGNTRQVYAGKLELGIVRMHQKRYLDAALAFEESRKACESLREPAGVATAWHLTGMVNRKAGSYDKAEHAYRLALSLRVKHKLRSEEGTTLAELGNLYSWMGRLEDAVNCYRQASEIHVELRDRRNETLARNSLASVLIHLGHLNEARCEIDRAIECAQPFGHVVEPWKIWDNLQNLEKAEHNTEAAFDARNQAVAAYVAYRRDGGESYEYGRLLCDQIAHAIVNESIGEAADALAAAGTEALNHLHALISKLQAILQGARDQRLGNDPALHYEDAAELTLLLERLKA